MKHILIIVLLYTLCSCSNIKHSTEQSKTLIIKKFVDSCLVEYLVYQGSYYYDLPLQDTSLENLYKKANNFYKVKDGKRWKLGKCFNNTTHALCSHYYTEPLSIDTKNTFVDEHFLITEHTKIFNHLFISNVRKHNLLSNKDEFIYIFENRYKSSSFSYLYPYKSNLDIKQIGFMLHNDTIKEISYIIYNNSSYKESISFEYTNNMLTKVIETGGDSTSKYKTTIYTYYEK